MRKFWHGAKVEVIAPVQVAQKKCGPELSRLRELTLVVNTGGVYVPDDLDADGSESP